MPVTSEVTSLDIPDLHQSILKENKEEDDGKIVVYILKELDDNETLKMLQKVYEAQVQKLDDQFVEVKAKSELSLERSAALHKRIILQEAKTHESIASLKSEIAALKNSAKWLRTRQRAEEVMRMLQTRQMAYSAVVRAIVNEFQRICRGPNYSNDVPMETVKARLLEIMSDETVRLAEIGESRPTFAKYITSDTVDQLLAKTDDRHICLDSDPYVTPGGTFYNLAELDQYVQRSRGDLSHGFGETERLVIHMYLAAIGKARTTDMLSREARALAGVNDLCFASASLINELSEFHDITPEHAEWSLFGEMYEHMIKDPRFANLKDSDSETTVYSSADSDSDSASESE